MGEGISWSTEDEIKYLQGVGTHRRMTDGEYPDPLPVEEMIIHLERYSKTMSFRKRWGAIDQVLISRWIDHKLEHLHSLKK
jgi:hypothetical protein